MGEQISQFDARYDAQTLAEASAISADPSRLAAAESAAKQLKIEAEAKVEDLANVAGEIYDHPSSVRAREKREQRAASQSAG